MKNPREQMTMNFADKVEDASENETIPFKYSISSYGADYTVDYLISRIESEKIYVPPFQRQYVWNAEQASRFIESLLLGLPIPGIFLSVDEESPQKLMVIDGQQRLSTLRYFYTGAFLDTGKEFALKGVQKQFIGRTYQNLDVADKGRLDNSILHATIIKQDEPSEDNSSIYYVFERLNTGGTLLQPQEIRSAIYHGKFNELLRKINKNEAWRNIYGSVSARMKDQELILRFLALYYNSENYSKPMKGFLNTYMAKNRNLSEDLARQFTEEFARTIGLIYEAIGGNAFRVRRVLNAAVFDSVMLGAAWRLSLGIIESKGELTQAYQHLLENKAYMKAIFGGTSDDENVKTRLRLAKEAFAKVK